MGKTLENALVDLLTDLRVTAESNWNKIGDKVMSARYDEWEIGYKIEREGQLETRKVFMKLNDGPIMSVPESDRDKVAQSIFDVFIHPMGGDMSIYAINEETLLFKQEHIPYMVGGGIVIQ